MTELTRLSKVKVDGLHGSYNYELEFSEGENTIILIAPNGYGKTALLTLIRDCLTLNLRRAANRVFDVLEITFIDRTRWKFTRKFSAEVGERKAEMRKRSMPRGAQYGSLDSPYWVDLTRYDKSGKKISEEMPDLEKIDKRLILRNIERHDPWILHQPDMFRARPYESESYSSEMFEKYFALASSDESVRRAISATNPKFVWPTINKIPSLFVETQRLLYSETKPTGENEAPKEEVMRQTETLSQLLQKNYADYAATSQGLDRSFPNRLIERAQSQEEIDPNVLKSELAEIEEKRADLTEVGILVEQGDAITTTDDTLVPTVLEALQVYVEDSKKKLATYDEIFPKLLVFKELLGNKLKPKQLDLGRDFGVRIKKGDHNLSLASLSSGEKHEFIMLFKLIFETEPGTLVLIDEPEISLHVVWQLEFMSDLRRIQGLNPFQCIIATHSPQIFQGFNNLLVDLADQV